MSKTIFDNAVFRHSEEEHFSYVTMSMLNRASTYSVCPSLSGKGGKEDGSKLHEFCKKFSNDERGEKGIKSCVA
jgi:hypothetical protein